MLAWQARHPKPPFYNKRIKCQKIYIKKQPKKKKKQQTWTDHMTKLCWFHEVSWRLKLEHVNFRVTFKKKGGGGRCGFTWSKGIYSVWMRWQVIIIVMFGFRGAGFIKFPGAPNPIQPPPFTIIICSCITQTHITGSHNTRKRKKRTKKKSYNVAISAFILQPQVTTWQRLEKTMMRSRRRAYCSS